MLLPSYIEKNYPDISLTMIGAIISIHEFATCITSPIAGKYMHVIGRKQAYIVGLVLVSMGCLAIGLLPYIKGSSQFLGFSLFFRFV